MPRQQVHVISPAPRDVWWDLINADREALPYQTPAWFDCICEDGGYEDASRLYELPGGRQLLLPMTRRRHLPSLLAVEESLPSGWGMGGLLAADSVTPEDVQTVFVDLASRPVLRTRIRPNPRSGQVWAAARHPRARTVARLAHVLDLDGGFDVVWTTRFTRRTRKHIRKAEKNGQIEIRCDSTGALIPVFYDLLLQSFDRWAQYQHEPHWLAHWRGRRRDPLPKFQHIAERLGDACKVWVAWINGEPAAATLVLQYANVNDARGAMNKELVGNSGANYLLQKLAIEDACAAGCRYYHLGESGESAGLAHYKSRFGAEPYAYAEYYLERVPLLAADTALRGTVKRAIGFKDA